MVQSKTLNLSKKRSLTQLLISANLNLSHLIKTYLFLTLATKPNQKTNQNNSRNSKQLKIKCPQIIKRSQQMM
jgi:hypothetical protein